ncbi:hypothetical protein HDU97_006471 [Phlyctochytrium planicorne]|nr:hypothetical protein HDU97_006471 [Phlyctochytrium planicorne]
MLSVQTGSMIPPTNPPYPQSPTQFNHVNAVRTSSSPLTPLANNAILNSSTPSTSVDQFGNIIVHSSPPVPVVATAGDALRSIQMNPPLGKGPGEMEWMLQMLLQNQMGGTNPSSTTSTGLPTHHQFLHQMNSSNANTGGLSDSVMELLDQQQSPSSATLTSNSGATPLTPATPGTGLMGLATQYRSLLLQPDATVALHNNGQMAMASLLSNSPATTLLSQHSLDTSSSSPATAILTPPTHIQFNSQGFNSASPHQQFISSTLSLDLANTATAANGAMDLLGTTAGMPITFGSTTNSNIFSTQQQQQQRIMHMENMSSATMVPYNNSMDGATPTTIHQQAFESLSPESVVLMTPPSHLQYGGPSFNSPHTQFLPTTLSLNLTNNQTNPSSGPMATTMPMNLAIGSTMMTNASMPMSFTPSTTMVPYTSSTPQFDFSAITSLLNGRETFGIPGIHHSMMPAPPPPTINAGSFGDIVGMLGGEHGNGSNARPFEFHGRPTGPGPVPPPHSQTMGQPTAQKPQPQQPQQPQQPPTKKRVTLKEPASKPARASGTSAHRRPPPPPPPSTSAITSSTSTNPDAVNTQQEEEMDEDPNQKFIEVSSSCKRCSRELATIFIYPLPTSPEDILSQPYVLSILCVLCKKELETGQRDEEPPDLAPNGFPPVEADLIKKRRKSRKDLGRNQRVFCSICQVDIGVGGARVPVNQMRVEGGLESSAVQKRKKKGTNGVDEGWEDEDEEVTPWIRPEFGVETICKRCAGEHRFCTSCSGGGLWRSGKWRIRALFKEGRKTCALDHTRAVPVTQARFVVYRVPFVSTKKSTVFDSLDPAIYGQPMDFLPYMSESEAFKHPSQWPNLWDEQMRQANEPDTGFTFGRESTGASGDDNEGNSQRENQGDVNVKNEALDEQSIEMEEELEMEKYRKHVPGLMSLYRDVSDFYSKEILSWFTQSTLIGQMRRRGVGIDGFKSERIFRNEFRSFMFGGFNPCHSRANYRDKEYRRFIVVAFVPGPKATHTRKTFDSILSNLEVSNAPFSSYQELGRPSFVVENNGGSIPDGRFDVQRNMGYNLPAQEDEIVDPKLRGWAIGGIAALQWNVTDRNFSFPFTACMGQMQLVPGSYLSACLSAGGLRVSTDHISYPIPAPLHFWTLQNVKIQHAMSGNVRKMEQGGFLSIEEYCSVKGYKLDKMTRELCTYLSNPKRLAIQTVYVVSFAEKKRLIKMLVSKSAQGKSTAQASVK